MSKNKGMRRSGRLLCLLAALAVLCAGYAVVSRVTQKEAAIETGGSFAVAEISPDEITSIAWQHEGETLSIFREDGGEWRLDGIEGFPLRQDLAEEIAENIASLEATHSVTGGADPADYGLDAPEETITVQLGSGDTLDYSMGALNEITGEYYLRFSKNEAIYTIASALDSLAPYGRAELLDAPEIPALDGATRLVIAGTDADVEQNYFADSTGMTYTDSYHWFHVGMDGAAQPSDADRVNALLDKISALSLTDCVDYSADETALASYGLSPAQLTVTAEYPAQSAEESEPAEAAFTLLIGGQDAETGEYYAALPDSQLVFRIDADTAERLLFATNDSLRADDVLLMDWTAVTGMEFTIGGESHILVRDTVETLDGADAEPAETAGAEPVETDSAEPAETAAPETVWTLDGSRVDDEKVAALEQALTALTSSGRAETAAGGAEVLRLTILRDSDSYDRVELAFSEYDAENYLYTLMGESRLLVAADAVDAIVRTLKYLGQ